MAGSDWREFETSSGVVLLYGPFPHGMYWDVMAKALEDHPDPDPPQKEIKVVDGTEWVDDEEDEDYQRELRMARLARYNLLGEAALEFAVEVKGGMGQYERVVRRMGSKYMEPPEDPDETRIWFLDKYALRTREDWEIVGLVQRFSQIEDEEVAARAEFFPGDVAGPEGDEADAPGPVEEQRVEVPGEAEGPDSS